jgi:hypothetical protein
MKKTILYVWLGLSGCLLAVDDAQVEQWGIFELALKGPATGNPFVGIEFSAVFENGGRRFEPEGFYDGDGVFKVRFMPDAQGVWTYRTKSNYPQLDGRTGQFVCTAPSAGNHGPVRVRNRYHFAYADGTPFFPFGTTLYEWPFQSEELKKQTVETLKQAPFNKARFLLIPPCKDHYLTGPNRLTEFPFVGDSRDNWDFSRFNPGYFRNLEWCVSQFRDLGIEADLILFHPYDKGKWGFDQMDALTNERYVRYVIARFAAFRNVWWCLANENSFLTHWTDADWDRIFQIVQQRDPYGHLRSIHNADRIYDYNKPWVTHVSLQYYMAVRYLGISPMLRDMYQKPIVHDEINYEGNIPRRWGNISGEEMVFRFWSAYIGGAYATHGDCYGSSEDPTWISIGGRLQGQSPPRIAFLRKIIESGPTEGIDPIDYTFEPNIGGRAGEYYLIYFGREPMDRWTLRLPKKNLQDGMRFQAEVIDTWNMTIEPVEGVFEIKQQDAYTFGDKDGRSVELPGRPYMAVRLKRVN